MLWFNLNRSIVITETIYVEKIKKEMKNKYKRE